MYMAWNSIKPVADSGKKRTISKVYIEPVTMGPYFHKIQKQGKEWRMKSRVSLSVKL